MAVNTQIKATPLDDIPKIVNGLHTTFHSLRTHDVQYRLVQLRKLYWGLKDHERELEAAVMQDLHKSAYETYLTESGWCMNDIVFVTKNLEKWAKEESAPDIPLTNKFFAPRIRKDPLGCVLIIGAYNFPIQLTIGPLIGAIAAGCTAVLKPSESAPAVANVLEKIITSVLDPSSYAVVQGAIPETTALLNQHWDKIFYTGSGHVGTIIAKKAAETLTPVVLELGGQNPAIVTKNADPYLAARRLLWGKTLNAGQVCVSQNYTMIDQEILPQFIQELKKAMAEFFPNGPKASPDYARIINQRSWARLKKMIDSSKGKILMGGDTDESELYIGPTVIQVSAEDDATLVEESFGPIIPILPVPDLSTAIRIANSVGPTSLGVYAFGSKAETERILTETRSGGASVNDAFFHASLPTLAFGGVGTSGQGAYRGKSSFDTFTHQRSVTTTPAWIEGMIGLRYPPYTAAKLKRWKAMADLAPDFDREGRFTGFGLVGWVLALGGKSKTAGLMRWVLVALVAFGARKYQASL